MSEWFQRATYEVASAMLLGEPFSALLAGFAAWINGEIYLTPAGERYLADRE